VLRALRMRRILTSIYCFLPLFRFSLLFFISYLILQTLFFFFLSFFLVLCVCFLPSFLIVLNLLSYLFFYVLTFRGLLCTQYYNGRICQKLLRVPLQFLPFFCFHVQTRNCSS
jgi:hypothetical protein